MTQVCFACVIVTLCTTNMSIWIRNVYWKSMATCLFGFSQGNFVDDWAKASQFSTYNYAYMFMTHRYCGTLIRWNQNHKIHRCTHIARKDHGIQAHVYETYWMCNELQVFGSRISQSHFWVVVKWKWNPWVKHMWITNFTTKTLYM